MNLLPIRDIHLPPAVGWWPPAPGWWALALLAVIVPLAGYWLLRRWRARPGLLRKAALSELSAIERDTELGDSDRLQRLSMLLRRVAVTVFPRHEVASLRGEEWLQWLDHALGGEHFSKGPGRILAEGPYRRETGLDSGLGEVFTLCRDWLNRLPYGG